MASSASRNRATRASEAAIVSTPNSRSQHKPRYPSFLEASHVPVLDVAADLGSATRAFTHMTDCQPFIMANSKLDADALDTSLIQALQSAQGGQLTPIVLCSQGPWHRLISLKQAANKDPASPYHITWPECKPILGIKAADLSSVMATWSSAKLLATLEICTFRWRANASSSCGIGLALQVSNNAVPVAMLQDLLSPLSAWLQAHLCEPAADLASALRLLPSDDLGQDTHRTQAQPFSAATVQLEWVSGGAVMPLKYETVARLVVQLAGERHVLLVPPEYSLGGGLAPFACAHPYDTYSAPGMASTACSAADPALVDHVCGLWPGFRQVRGSSCTLQPGHVLFIPPFWSVHVETGGSADASKGAACEGNRALVLCLHTPPAPHNLMVPSPAALTLQASRFIEHWVVSFAGIRQSRDLLVKLAESLQQPLNSVSAHAGAKEQDNGGPEDMTEPDGILSSSLSSSLSLRHWSQRLCHAVPSIAANDVGKYKLTMLAQDILDALALCGGPEGCMSMGQHSGAASGHWHQSMTALTSQHAAFMLHSMCDGRLFPTPWLDQYGKADVGVPQHLLKGYSYPAPRLTAQEAAFPELFTMVVEAKEMEAAELARQRHMQRLKQLVGSDDGCGKLLLMGGQQA